MAHGFRHVPRQRTAARPGVAPEDWEAAILPPDAAAGRLLQDIFGGGDHQPGSPFTHTLKLPETEEEMAAAPLLPSFTLSEDEP